MKTLHRWIVVVLVPCFVNYANGATRNGQRATGHALPIAHCSLHLSLFGSEALAGPLLMATNGSTPPGLVERQTAKALLFEAQASPRPGNPASHIQPHNLTKHELEALNQMIASFYSVFFPIESQGHRVGEDFQSSFRLYDSSLFSTVFAQRHGSSLIFYVHRSFLIDSLAMKYWTGLQDQVSLALASEIKGAITRDPIRLATYKAYLLRRALPHASLNVTIDSLPRDIRVRVRQMTPFYQDRLRAAFPGEPGSWYDPLLYLRPDAPLATRLKDEAGHYMGARKYTEAIPLLNRVIALEPGNPGHHAMLGNAFMNVRKWEEAIQESIFETLLSSNMERAYTYLVSRRTRIARALAGGHANSKSLKEADQMIDAAFSHVLRRLPQQNPRLNEAVFAFLRLRAA